MNIKRYDFDRAHCTGDSEFGCPSSMEECSCGDYVRWEDLIAAGCLVPVPDGEATTYWDSASENSVYASAGHLYAEHGELTVAIPITGGQPMTAHTIVQPVRLVPLEDVG